MRHPAVALLELLIVIGIMGIIASMAIPLYWRYQARNNLELAKNQVTQGLERARLNARAGKYDDVWSFSVSEGILFEGSDFAGRDQSRQEVYTLPGDIVPSGILQVTYDKTGTPNTTGTVTLSSPLGDVATVQVTTIVSSQQVSTTAGSTLVICYQGTTMTITSDQWSFYQAKGAASGACPSNLCPSKFTADATGLITFTANGTLTYQNFESQIQSGGTQVPVYICKSTDGGSSFKHILHDNGNCTADNPGQAVQQNGVDNTSDSFSPAQTLIVQVRGSLSSSFSAVYATNDQTGHVVMLHDGNDPRTVPGLQNQTALINYLQTNGYLNDSGKISIGPCNLLVLAELETLGGSSADFDDDVLELMF
ncbi:hypothetical protein HY285_02845 [Candidatus Peregrinibacteria bacterium]|nr:hypothetical protein [Candidatus Peregrinibacteria bacterium]